MLSLLKKLFGSTKEVVIVAENVSMRHFFSKVAGVSYRQAAVKKLKSGEQLQAIAEPLNEHDPDAVALFNLKGKQIGYLPAGRLPKQIVSDKKNDYLFFVKEKTGGYKKTTGVNLLIVVVPSGTPAQQIRPYCQKALDESN